MNAARPKCRFRAWLPGAILIAGLLTAVSNDYAITLAQVTDESWSQPFRLSHIGAQVGEPALVADRFGAVNVFWGEWSSAGAGGVVQHSRFDGETWSEPNDVVAGAQSRISRVAVDQGPDGVLHMLWSSGADLMYSSVPAGLANIAPEWSQPETVASGVVPNYFRIRVDRSGQLHVLYSSYLSDDSGVFHLSISPDADSWPSPKPIDTNFEDSWSPWIVQLALGEGRVLHAVWHIGDENGHAVVVRYARSLDEGESWSAPIDVFKPDPSIGLGASIPYPSLLAIRGEVHLMWAASRAFDDGTRYILRRLHLLSLDDGSTWSEPSWVYGELEGMAAGDALVGDGAGRVHWISQVRAPMGVYHAVWRENSWSDPNVVYEIVAPGSLEIDGGIHVHNVRAAIRGGDQLVIAFTTAPSDLEQALFAMVREPFADGAQTPAPLSDSPERNQRARQLPTLRAPEATQRTDRASSNSTGTRPIRSAEALNPSASGANRMLFFVGLIPMLLLVVLILIRIRRHTDS